MAARLTAERATEPQLKQLREMFSEFEQEPPAEHVNEYSQANIAFHQTIIALSRCDLIGDMTENLFLHMRAIRSVSMRQENRSEISIREHMDIISALERRDALAAERAAQREAGRSEDFKAGVAAFLRKMQPRFEGR